MPNFNDTQRLDWLLATCGISREVIDARMAYETEPKTAPLPFPSGSAGTPVKRKRAGKAAS